MSTEYRNTLQLFIGVNLLKIVGPQAQAREWRRRRRWREWGLGTWAGVSHLHWGGVWGPRKFFDFVLRNVGLLCILDSGV